MKTIITTIYVSNDGKLFKTEKECQEYESIFEDNKKAKKVLTLIQEICNKYGGSCSKCPFKVPNECCVFQIDVEDNPTDYLNYFKGL